MSLRHDPRTAPLAEHRRSAPRMAGGTLIGVFIGVVVGLAIAAGVAFYLMRSGNPYQSANAGKDGRDVASARGGKGESGKPRFDFYKILPGGEEPKAGQRVPGGVEKAPAERPLTSPDKGIAPEQRPAPADVARNPSDTRTASLDARGSAPDARTGDTRTDRFWLQAGSFSSAGDAENLKARLALAGWEAAVQEADVPDKGVRYRVRLGPYDNTDELNRIRSELVRRGFDVAVIKF